MTVKIECVAPTRSQIGEGAVWDDRAQVLWWVDIPAGYIHRYAPTSGENETFEFGEPVGCLAVREAGGPVLAAMSGFWFYDPETGTPSEPIVFFDTHAVPGRPDGGTVDAEGCYWQAGIDGWQLYRISPAGEVVQTVDMPIERPSKPTFGGENLDILFVTSLGLGLAPGTEGRQPEAGSLFALSGLGIKGMPQARFGG